MTDPAFHAYREYLAIKKHFTSSYDYFKYNGKVNVSTESFLARKDLYQFQRLSKKKDYKNLILSNVIQNPKLWVGVLHDEKANQIYLDWKKRTDSITQTVRDEISRLNPDFKSNFVSERGHYPHIMELFMGRQISLETLTILSKLADCIQYWKQTVVDKVIFPDFIRKMEKYHPFLIYSDDNMKKTVERHFFDQKNY